MLEIFSINWIEPLYRPVIDIMTEEIVTVEISSRLQHPEKGYLNQDEIMPAFNQTGLLELLYTEKLNLALKEIQKKNVNINILIDVECSLFKNDISAVTESLCLKYQYSCSKVTINIVNSSICDITEEIILNLNKMKKTGVILSLSTSDFPALRLNNHRDIPFDIVQIDKSLTRDILKNFKSREIAKTLINISKTFDLKCMAAGVDDVEIWNILKEMGVFACQGEYISSSITLDELIQKKDVLFTNNNDKLEAKEFKSIIYLNDVFISYRLRNYLSDLFKNISFTISYDLTDLQSYLDESEIQSILIDSETLQALLKEKSIVDCENIHKIIALNNQIDTNEYDFEHDKVTFLDFENTLSATAKKIANILTIPVEHAVNLSVLSHQERIVIDYLMKGATNKHISAKMMLSEKTISSYKKRALSKLNVKSIVELFKSA